MVTGMLPSGTTRSTVEELVAAVEAIPDPEVPVVTIMDLGILRGVAAEGDTGEVTVTITPTYSGCPAVAAITDQITHVCRRHGYVATVATILSPAWTTDWLSPLGRERLAASGIAPPAAAGPVDGPAGAGSPAGAGGPAGAVGPVPVSLARHVVACPQCGSTDTTELAHFGSTACKALRRCETCREPFEEFKAI